MSISVEMKGREEVARAMRLLGKKAPKAMGAALWNEARSIIHASQKIVPFKEGILSESGTYNLPEYTDDGVSVTLGYGGAASDYAAVQHEELSYYHKPPTQAKFLQQPFIEAADGMGLRIVQTLWGKLK